MSAKTTTTQTPTEASRVASAEDRYRQAIELLTERGIASGHRRMALEAAAAVIERCCEEFDRRGDVGTGWLVQSILEGSVWFQQATARPRRYTPSELLVMLDANREAA